ncbi:hypothetical protein Aau02nite_85760 [Amorphoplanes auranticolor]|uniref:Uncharacterized protein n=1 Tax=Actinoplanes auranticolor TaxID=47988 RepID=A0A919SYE4_9ACTN|nr:hypothetical protein Aau02nite_85760 [Actinoplanes auranticolor]
MVLAGHHDRTVRRKARAMVTFSHTVLVNDERADHPEIKLGGKRVQDRTVSP